MISMDPHSAREITGGFCGGPCSSGAGKVMGVEVGVGVNVAVLVGLGGTCVAVGDGVAEGVAVAVGVEMGSAEGVDGAKVAVCASDPCAVCGIGSMSLSSRAATTPATRLKTGMTIHALPTDLRCMSFHYTSL